MSFPDVEGAMRTWAKSRPALTALVGSRVFLTYDGDPELPFLDLYLATDAAGDEESPEMTPRVAWNVWGANKRQAAELSLVLMAQLLTASNQLLNPGTYCHDVSHLTRLWLPDDEAKLARYVVEADVTVSAR